VGEVTITAVLESATVFTPDFVREILPAATRDNLATMPWLQPAWVDAELDPRMVVQALVVRSAGKIIVVDTCIGNDKARKNPRFHRLQTSFLADLAAVVGAPEAVDLVLCTHLHFDHVGWNTRWDGARWVPTFPRARYLVARAELDHWLAVPGHRYVVEDSLQPVLDAGLVDAVASDHALTAEVQLVPTAGHTPGHVSVRIRSGGAEALITGDALHHPCQVGHPEWSGPADADRERAAATRRALVEDAARRGVLLVGTHFAAPAAGWVVAQGDRHRLDPAWPLASDPGA